jgi:hypothetical protein
MTEQTSNTQSSSELSPSSSCTSFGDTLVFACGEQLLVHTLSSFLSDFSNPQNLLDVNLSNSPASVTLLRHVALGEPAGTVQHNFLIVGMSTGSLFVVDAK